MNSQARPGKTAEGIPARRPDMPQAIATLRHEHRYFESILNVLDQQAGLAAVGECDFDLLRDIVRYLISYPDAYHHPREDAIFERLMEVDPDSHNSVQSLIDGHRAMYRETKILRDLVDAGADGESVETEGLRDTIARYTSSYRTHIRNEDKRVFPRAVKMLTQEDWEAVNQVTRQAQDPLFGPFVKQKYQRIAEDLYESAELVRRRVAVAEILGIEAVIEGVATLSAAAWDIGRIALSKATANTSDNMQATKRSLGSGSPRQVVDLPFEYARNTRTHLEAGITEIGEVLGRTSDAISRPYATRMNTLKNLLRRDWTE